MRNIQIYASAAATGNAIAQIVIPAQTRLKACQVAFYMDSAGDNAICKCELSKTATGSIGALGAVDPFLSVALWNNLLTSGMTIASLNYTFPLDVECRQGEIIYLHCTVAVATQFFFNGIFHY